MTRVLNQSDIVLIRSDEHEQHFRNRGSAGFDRRHLPGVPASGMTALFRVQLAFGQAGRGKRLKSPFLPLENSPDVA